MDSTNDFGDKLKYHRLQNDLTQKELGNLIGLSSSHISGIESGKKGASIDVIKLLAKALNLPVSVFIEDQSYVIREHFENYGLNIPTEIFSALNDPGSFPFLEAGLRAYRSGIELKKLNLVINIASQLLL